MNPLKEHPQKNFIERTTVLGTPISVRPIITNTNPGRSDGISDDQQAAWFDDFWQIFWVKRDRAGAWEAFKAIVGTRSDYEALCTAMLRDSPGQRRLRRAERHSATYWLRGYVPRQEADPSAPNDDSDTEYAKEMRFQEFWKVFWKKTSIEAARKAFAKTILNDSELAFAMEAVRRDRPKQKARNTWDQHSASLWLRQYRQSRGLQRDQ